MRRRHPLSLLLLLLLLPRYSVAVEPPPAPTTAPTPQTPPALGHWEGVIQVPGIELRVLIDLSQKDKTLAGTIDIPQQGAKGLPLDAVAVPSGADGAEGKVHFAIQGVPGAPTFDGTLAGSEIQGTFSQGGQSFPFHLGREVVPPPARPQEPKPPFPYTAEEVHYENNGIQLAGTLTLPPGDGPFPAVLLLTGSGAQNRDEEIFGHKPFLVLADHLTRAGIAVLRMDDRGVGGSTGSVARSTTSDFADDALAGVRFLKTHPHIAPGRIGLLGHSEGGIIAPLAATRSRDVAFVILLAGTGVPGSQVILDQGARIARVEGAPEERIRQQREGQKKVFELMQTEKDPAALRTKLRDLLRAQIALLPETERKALGDNLDLAVDKQVEQALTPWFRYFIAYDPRPALTQIRVPVLALNGEKDLQVAPDLNLPAIAQALKTAKDRDVTLKRLPGLNHLFQHATTGDIAEYAKSEETISPEVLEIVTKWILVRFGKGGSGPHRR